MNWLRQKWFELRHEILVPLGLARCMCCRERIGWWHWTFHADGCDSLFTCKKCGDEFMRALHREAAR